MRTRKRKRKPKADQPQFRPGDVVQYLKQTKTGETWVYAMIEACNQRSFRISYEWFGNTYMKSNEMECRLKSGPDEGKATYLSWPGILAREENGAIILTDTEDFFKITNIGDER